jgi:hypothetical protein
MNDKIVTNKSIMYSLNTLYSVPMPYVDLSTI